MAELLDEGLVKVWKDAIEKTSWEDMKIMAKKFKILVGIRAEEQEQVKLEEKFEKATKMEVRLTAIENKKLRRRKRKERKIQLEEKIETDEVKVEDEIEDEPPTR